eukprot:GHVN01019736.1.p2 GENE.GHVN01019736.1~~GHVN01019736.1.p2  ORF type:complete len:204 (+),score=15.29 GHVN01019736.1:2415-3026(+)
MVLLCPVVDMNSFYTHPYESTAGNMLGEAGGIEGGVLGVAPPFPGGVTRDSPETDPRARRQNLSNVALPLSPSVADTSPCYGPDFACQWPTAYSHDGSHTCSSPVNCQFSPYSISIPSAAHTDYCTTERSLDAPVYPIIEQSGNSPKYSLEAYPTGATTWGVLPELDAWVEPEANFKIELGNGDSFERRGNDILRKLSLFSTD